MPERVKLTEATGKWSAQLLRDIVRSPFPVSKRYFAAKKLVALGFAGWRPHALGDRLHSTDAGRLALQESDQ